MSRYNHYYSPTKVTITWQQTSEVYALKLHKPPGSNYFPKEHWTQFNTLIKPILLSIPSGSEREYDPVEETWFFAEKYYPSIKACIESLSNFKVEVMEKPPANAGIRNTIPDITLMKSNFTALTGISPDEVNFKDAKRAYFKLSMKLHPDHNKIDPDKFYLLNESWQELEYQFYKTKQRIVDLKETEVTYG